MTMMICMVYFNTVATYLFQTDITVLYNSFFTYIFKSAPFKTSFRAFMRYPDIMHVFIMSSITFFFNFKSLLICIMYNMHDLMYGDMISNKYIRKAHEWSPKTTKNSKIYTNPN